VTGWVLGAFWFIVAMVVLSLFEVFWKWIWGDHDD